MKSEIFVLSDNAIISKQGKLSIIGIFNQLFAVNFPTTLVKCSIVAVVSGKPNSNHQITLEMLTPEKKPLTQKHPTFNVQLGPSGKSNLISQITNLPLKAPGEYNLRLKKDGKTLAKTTLNVVKANPKNQKLN